MDRDRKHLRWLAIAHYILGGLIGLICLFFLLSMIPGCAVTLFPKAHCTGAGRCPTPFFGFFYNTIGLITVLGGLALAGFIAMTGWYLVHRQRYRFCLIMAGVEGFLLLPVGTVLGLLTFAVLLRDSVARQFGHSQAAAHSMRPPPGSPGQY